MDILIVEDDYLQADWITKALHAVFSGITIGRIGTESEFYSRIDEIRKTPPKIIVLDIMLPWSPPREEMPEPPTPVREGEFYRAGLRCEELLSQYDETKNIPVILYSVLERSDLAVELPLLPSNVQYISKQADPSPLINRIRELTSL